MLAFETVEKGVNPSTIGKIIVFETLYWGKGGKMRLKENHLSPVARRLGKKKGFSTVSLARSLIQVLPLSSKG